MSNAVLSRGDRVKLIGRDEWPHFKQREAIVTKLVRKGRMENEDPNCAVVKLRVENENIRLLRQMSELEYLEDRSIMKDFEKFEDWGKARSTITKEPKAALSKTGLLQLNSKSLEVFGVLDYKYAVLYFSRSGKKIGIALTNDEKEAGARPMRFKRPKPDSPKNAVNISIKTFCTHYGILSDKLQRYDISRDAETNMLVLEREG